MHDTTCTPYSHPPPATRVFTEAPGPGARRLLPIRVASGGAPKQGGQGLPNRDPAAHGFASWVAIQKTGAVVAGQNVCVLFLRRHVERCTLWCVKELLRPGAVHQGVLDVHSKHHRVTRLVERKHKACTLHIRHSDTQAGSEVGEFGCDVGQLEHQRGRSRLI